MTLVDTNVLVDLARDTEWAGWSVEKLSEAAGHGLLWINPVIYAEVSPLFATRDELTAFLSSLGLNMTDFTREALFRAGHAHREYRRRGGERQRMLADFLIGAQADVTERAILTRDPRPYRTYFPDVRLITP